MHTNSLHPIIAVFFNQPGKLDYPFGDELYYESYADFTAYCSERDVDLVIVRGVESYLGNMQFSHGWRFVGNDLREINEPITANLIYNKELSHDLVTNSGDLVINDPVFDKIGRDKWLTAQAFPELVPTTYQITSDNWRDVLQKIPSDKVVLKPVSGTEGKGIVVVDKDQLDFPGLGLTQPYIAQEFIDSSGGIPGICEGMHDLRLYLFNGQPRLVLVRQPREGSVLSNIAQGGKSYTIDLQQVPTEFVEAAATIDTYYQQYVPRIYTTDFFMANGRIYLIETNTRPGFPHVKTYSAEFVADFYRYLFDVLTQAIEVRRRQA